MLDKIEAAVTAAFFFLFTFCAVVAGWCFPILLASGALAIIAANMALHVPLTPLWFLGLVLLAVTFNAGVAPKWAFPSLKWPVRVTTIVAAVVLSIVTTFLF